MFENLITSDFKKIFENAIDTILSCHGLATECELQYDSSNNSLCTNCIYDTINKKSANIYNNTGPVNFPEGSICPVCLGQGKVKYTKKERIHLALIVDSKSWLNWGSISVNIPNLAAQTLSDISTMNQLMSCTSMKIVGLEKYDTGHYLKAGFPEPLGLDNKKYILTNWVRP